MDLGLFFNIFLFTLERKRWSLGQGDRLLWDVNKRAQSLGALFEKANHLNPQRESNTRNYIKLLGFLRKKAITRHDLASRKVIRVTI